MGEGYSGRIMAANELFDSIVGSLRPDRFENAPSHNPEIGMVASESSLDIASAPHLQRKIQNLIEAGAQTIILDLTNTSQIDARGFMILIEAQQKLRFKGGQLLLIHMSQNIRQFFTDTGLIRTFKIYGSEIEALQALQPMETGNLVDLIEDSSTS